MFLPESNILGALPLRAGTSENPAAAWYQISSKVWFHIPAWLWLYELHLSLLAHIGWTLQLLFFGNNAVEQTCYLKHFAMLRRSWVWGGSWGAWTCCCQPPPLALLLKVTGGWLWGCVRTANQLLHPAHLMAAWKHLGQDVQLENSRSPALSVLMDIWVFQRGAGLQTWVVPLLSHSSGVKSFAEGLGYPIFSRETLKVKPVLWAPVLLWCKAGGGH